MIILGAGLAGCIAAHLFPESMLMEGAPDAEKISGHRALLRFRTDAISKITAIPFRKVRVTKEVFWRGTHGMTERLPLFMRNAYSMKVVGRYVERSIGNLEPAERFVAPTDFHHQLLWRLRDRIQYNKIVQRVTKTALWEEGDKAGTDRTEEEVISTIPLPLMLGATLGAAVRDSFKFDRAAIYVWRGHVRNCDAFQTVYFPDPQLGVYRASVTGSLLIIESISSELSDGDFSAVLDAFGFRDIEIQGIDPFSPVRQSYGKINPLEEAERRSLLLRLTREFGVFSFGRFATWRNILLDDLPQDAEKIRRLVRMSDYERQLESI